jgi:hypothetical protein
MPLALCLVLPSLQPLIMIHDLLVTVLVLFHIRLSPFFDNDDGILVKLQY